MKDFKICGSRSSNENHRFKTCFRKVIELAVFGEAKERQLFAFARKGCKVNVANDGLDSKAFSDPAVEVIELRTWARYSLV